MAGIVARAEVDLAADPERVWAALTDPAQIEQFMFGSKVETTWQPGRPITWTGEYEGKIFQDKGEVLSVEPQRELVVTHFSPLSGKEDAPENYHMVAYHLEASDDGTHLTLEQDNNGSEEEAEHSRQNWAAMLDKLKEVVEREG